MEHRHCPSLPPRRSSELAAEYGRLPGDVVAIRVDPGEVGMPEPDLALDGQAGELAGRDADRLQRSHPAVIGPVVAAAVPRDAIVGPHEGDRAGRGRYREPGHRVLEADSRRTVRRILQEPTLVVDHLGAERSPVRIPPFEDLPARFLAILDHHGAPADRVVAV